MRQKSPRRQLMREQRRLLIPTRIAIIICAIFFSFSLIVAKFLSSSLVQARLTKFDGASQRLHREDVDSEQLQYKDWEQFRKRLPEGLGAWPDVSLNAELSTEDLGTNNERSSYVGSLSLSPDVKEEGPYNIIEGRLPQEGELVFNKTLADLWNVKLGDDIYVSVTSYKGELPERQTQKFHIVGLSKTIQGKFIYEGIYLSKQDFEKFYLADTNRAENTIQDIYLYEHGRSLQAEDLPALGLDKYRLETRAAVEDEMQRELFGEKAVNPISVVLLLFVMISVLVSGLIISNTFQVLVARQRKTFALFRAIGATKRQIYHWVLADGLSLGLISSLIGAALPQLLVYGLDKAGVTVGGMHLHGLASPRHLLLPVLVLTAFTLLSVLGSARSATRVRALEALRPLELIQSPQARRRRGVFSILITLLGFGAMVLISIMIHMDVKRRLEISQDRYISIFLLGFLAATLCLLGLIFSAKIWMPQLLRFTQRVARRFSPSFQIASANIQKNPRRSSLTGLALMIGVVLVSTITTGAASVERSMQYTLQKGLPVDMRLSHVKEVAGIDRVLEKHKNLVLHSLHMETVLASSEQGQEDFDKALKLILIPDEGLKSVVHGGAESFGSNELWIGADCRETFVARFGHMPQDGETVKLYFAEGQQEQDFTLRVSRSNLPTRSSRGRMLGYVRAQDFASYPKEDKEIWLRIREDSQLQDLVKLAEGLSAVGGGFESEGAIVLRIALKVVIQTIMYVMLGLVAVALLIALIGISNTLMLAVLERQTETATLRIIGMSRSQLRRSLSYEALLLAALGTVSGIVLGILFGIFGTYLLLGYSLVGEVYFALNWPLLLIVVGLAALCAWLASILPARQALRTSPIEAMAD